MVSQVKKLRVLASEGWGVGHGSRYRPLLQVTTRTLSPNSFTVLRWLPMLDRYGHFRSYNEWLVAVFFLWLGVCDLREQYPLWPWKDPHPLFGRLDYCPKIPLHSPGLLILAAELGIRHHVGSLLVYVANEDLMVTVQDEEGPWAVMVSCKPENMFEAGVLSRRNTERLLLAETFASRLGISWWLMSQADIPQLLLDQLDGLERYAIHPDKYASVVPRFADAVENQIVRGVELEHCRRVVSARLGIDRRDYDWLLNNAIWNRRVSIDLRHPRNPERPAARTDFAWVTAAKKRLLGRPQ